MAIAPSLGMTAFCHRIAVGITRVTLQWNTRPALGNSALPDVIASPAFASC